MTAPRAMDAPTSPREVVESLRLLVVGAQKGGSTALARALASHPSLFLPRDEIPLFEGRLWSEASIRAAADRLRPGGGRVLGIKRADLLGDRQAPGRIADAVRDPLVVAVLRDPVVRAVSGYWWYVQLGLLPLEPVDRGMTRLLDAREQGRSLGTRADHVLDYGFYGEAVDRYRDALGADRVVVLLPDDVADGSWSSTVADALHVPRRPLEVRSENRGTYDERRLAVLRARTRLLPDSLDPDYHDRRRRLRYRAGRVVARGLNEVDRRLLARLPARPVEPLGPDVEERLRDLYREDGVRLATSLGRPVPWNDEAGPEGRR